jgi:signal peptidase I
LEQKQADTETGLQSSLNQETGQDAGQDSIVDKPQIAKQSRRSAIWAEIKGLFWLLLAVLGFHSFIAKPFYIPSISMMPNLLVGDRLFVSKYAYGWSHVSPTIPNPVAIFRWLVLREEVDSLAFMLPESKGRMWGKMPERGDIVILTPKGKTQDWIKRVIGLPGDTLEVRDGRPIINGQPVKQELLPNLDLAVDANNPCTEYEFPGALTEDASGKLHCMVNVVRETLPNGAQYQIIDARRSAADNMASIKIPAGHVFLMGDNRDNSADSRVSSIEGGLGGPVSWDRLGGRAEIITFSVDGSTSFNPASWFSSLRGSRSGTSLRPAKVPPPKKEVTE